MTTIYELLTVSGELIYVKTYFSIEETIKILEWEHNLHIHSYLRLDDPEEYDDPEILNYFIESNPLLN